MSGKQMEGDNRQRRRKGRDAKEQGRQASEEGATFGASKQRQKVDTDDHREKVLHIRKGKQRVIRENTPAPRPGYGES
jgi:hypothetical protein